MKRTMAAVLATAMVLGLTWGVGPCSAHEFIVKPVQLQAPPGHKLPFSVVSAHVFMISEEMEPPEQVEVSLMGDAGQEPVSLKPNDVLLTLDGAVDLKDEGTRVLAGHRKGMIWTHTTQGWKQASKKGLEGVLSSGMYEKFCKTLVTVGQPDDGYGKVAGHALEIVPLDDPAKAAVGRDLKFQVLFNGKPLPAEVYATYDGFTDAPNTYAYFTETDAEGRARVRITRPGTWMVRVQHTLDEPTEDYDKRVLRAVLVFGVTG